MRGGPAPLRSSWQGVLAAGRRWGRPRPREHRNPPARPLVLAARTQMTLEDALQVAEATTRIWGPTPGEEAAIVLARAVLQAQLRERQV